jgi:hypothetical protein
LIIEPYVPPLLLKEESYNFGAAGRELIGPFAGLSLKFLQPGAAKRRLRSKELNI